MLVADKYIVIHLSKQAGTSIERYLETVDPSVRRVGEKHNWRSENSSTLPTIAIVRNPYDWYVSVYNQYRAVNHPLYEVIGGTFEEFTSTLLCMPTEAIRELESLDWSKTYPREHSGLTSESFKDYDYGVGYYTWLWKKAHLSQYSDTIVVPMTGRVGLQKNIDRVLQYLKVPALRDGDMRVLNRGVGSAEDYRHYYSEDLYNKVSERDSYMVETFRGRV